ncbi:hypothetical protein NMY22_g10160 [Coprinellus aureogranulatus]|nr:hypothetical protein NMY22_g10160 [Coprinellus aureogranulatus]
MDGLPTLASMSLSDSRNSNNPNDASGRSGILGLVRPTFLRTLTGGRGGASPVAGQQSPPQASVEMTEGGVNGRPVPLDVESTAGLGRTGS